MNHLIVRRSVLGAAIASVMGIPHLAAHAQGFALEEVVVTARKREESLQDVPVAVSSFSASDLAAYNMSDTKELAAFTPSLFIETNSANNLSSAKTTIRGQVQTDSIGTVDPSVGWYIDDVYLARTTGTVASMFDLERVEVLKGPQGTLYGRNTTGGAIKLITTKADPSGELGGYVTAGIGNLGANKVGGAVNIPLVEDVLAVRLVALSDQIDDGYGSQEVRRPAVAGLPVYAGTLVDFQTTRKDAGQKDLEMYRIGATLNASEDLTFTLNYEQNDFYANALLLNYVSGPLHTAPADFYDGGVSNALQEAWNEVETLSFTAEYDITDNLATKFVYGWRDMKSRFVSDVDGTPLTLNYFILPFRQESEQESLEWQLTGDAMDGKLEWMTGLYYFEEQGLDGATSNGGASVPLGIFAFTTNATIDRNISRSAFVSGTLHLTDTVNFNGGVRYTKDSKPVSVYSTLWSPAGIECRFSPSAPNANLDTCTWSTGDNYEYVSWTAGFDWAVAEDVLTYIKSSNSQRAGGQNMRGLGVLEVANDAGGTSSFDTTVPFGPEEATDLELGVKGQFLDNTLQVNAAYYHIWYNDVQKSELLNTDRGLITFIRNASEATYDGIEAEVRWIASDNLMFVTTLSKIDWAYDNTNDFSAAVPDEEFTLRVNYNIPTAIGDAMVDVNYSYRGEMYPSSSASRAVIEGAPESKVDSVDLVGARVSLDLADYPINLALWGKNLSDEEYTLSPLVLNVPAKLYAMGVGMPRTYGIDLTYNF